ncbi:hypothetical protein AY599_04020 [Leptolyngbya valderiana BDU 20041]|nr:hypothetical protein AY599_04020 [Leptolyngbya valderiana BDU 20041]
MKAFRQKGKYVKYCGFAATVGTEKDRQRCNVSEFEIVKGAIIFDLELFDSGNSRFSHWMTRYDVLELKEIRKFRKIQKRISIENDK